MKAKELYILPNTIVLPIPLSSSGVITMRENTIVPNLTRVPDLPPTQAMARESAVAAVDHSESPIHQQSGQVTTSAQTGLHDWLKPLLLYFGAVIAASATGLFFLWQIPLLQDLPQLLKDFSDTTIYRPATASTTTSTPVGGEQPIDPTPTPPPASNTESVDSVPQSLTVTKTPTPAPNPVPAPTSMPASSPEAASATQSPLTAAQEPATEPASTVPTPPTPAPGPTAEQASTISTTPTPTPDPTTQQASATPIPAQNPTTPQASTVPATPTPTQSPTTQQASQQTSPPTGTITVNNAPPSPQSTTAMVTNPPSSTPTQPAVPVFTQTNPSTPLTTNAVPAPTAELTPQQEIEQLLTNARQQMENRRLTSPSSGNALRTYQRVLELQPNNPTAIEGIQRITTYYQDIARQSLQQGRTDEGLAYVNRGLRASPNNQNLLTLRRDALLVKQREEERRQAQLLEERRQEAERQLVQQQNARRYQEAPRPVQPVAPPPSGRFWQPQPQQPPSSSPFNESGFNQR